MATIRNNVVFREDIKQFGAGFGMRLSKEMQEYFNLLNEEGNIRDNISETHSFVIIPEVDVKGNKRLVLTVESNL